MTGISAAVLSGAAPVHASIPQHKRIGWHFDIFAATLFVKRLLPRYLVLVHGKFVAICGEGAANLATSFVFV